MTVPLWCGLVVLAVAKKAAVLLAAHVYGVPRVYRRSLKVAKFLVKDPKQREIVNNVIKNVTLLPNTLAGAVSSSRPALPAHTTAAISFQHTPTFASSAHAALPVQQSAAKKRLGPQLKLQSAQYLQALHLQTRSRLRSFITPADEALLERFRRFTRQPYNLVPAIS